MNSPTAPGSTTVDTYRQWLVQRVAFYLDRPPADIDPAAALAELGIDSVYAVNLCGDIEDAYDIEVDPTLAWDYPTLDAIARFLHEELGETAGVA